jgi:hypothetical protein
VRTPAATSVAAFGRLTHVATREQAPVSLRRFASLPSESAHEKQQDHRTDERGNDGTHQSTARKDPELTEQPPAHESADDADEDRTPEAKGDPFDDAVGEKTGDGANDDPDNDGFD